MTDDLKAIFDEPLVGVDELKVGLHAVREQWALSDAVVWMLQLLRAWLGKGLGLGGS